jgi:hypothetical protein
VLACQQISVRIDAEMGACFLTEPKQMNSSSYLHFVCAPKIYCDRLIRNLYRLTVRQRLFSANATLTRVTIPFLISHTANDILTT